MIYHIASLGTAGNLLTTIYYKNWDIATTRDFKTFERYRGDHKGEIRAYQKAYRENKKLEEVK